MLNSRYSLTPAASRIIETCQKMAVSSDVGPSWGGHLVLALLLDESVASACLRHFDVTLAWLGEGAMGAAVAAAARQFGQDAGIDQELASLSVEIDGNSPASDIASVRGAADHPLSFTRILDRAVVVARRLHSDDGVGSSHLLLALLEVSEAESRVLAARGATIEEVAKALGLAADQTLPTLSVQCDLAVTVEEPNGIWPETSADMASVARVAHTANSKENHPVNNERSSAAGIASSPGNGIDRVWRILDASLNRAREGLRVLEDYTRFVCDDATASRQIKQMRHDLVLAEIRILASDNERRLLSPDSGSAVSDAAHGPLGSRSTETDVGTQITVSGETRRDTLSDVVTVNCRRIQESLRSLEEFGKLVSRPFAAQIKQMRYSSYRLEQQLMTVHCAAAAEPGQVVDFSASDRRKQQLAAAQLYVLVTEQSCALPWKQFVEAVLLAGVPILQLREKHVNDAELLRRSRWMAAACREAGCLLIINDRPDIAVLSNADGVHVGQEELPAADARIALQPGQLLGVSTHSVAQARAAVAAGADYLGVGPVFMSHTKQFDAFPGLEFVKQVAAQVSVPWFAIGGIGPSNLAQVTECGASRVAITAAISRSTDPAAVVAELRNLNVL